MMRAIILSQADLDKIFAPQRRLPQEEARRQHTLARAGELGRLIGPLTTERLRAGVPFPVPGLVAHD
ncbi:hypothetical protein CVO96_16565 [Deinococcus koreensis]|uniref:Uncharacterized protein n=1 Tax=Deinococcus koreensis TaxID=2054903 RepID=A0A2K3V1U3_9DEIO|nr:hypothetical protein CVO96_16565 [Deinococcus koreensis]